MLVHGLADDNVVVAHTLRLSSALLAAGNPHEVLPLSGMTHMANDEVVAENLLLLQLDFLRRSLGHRAADVGIDASGAQPEPARCGVEAGGLQGCRQRRPEDVLAVGTFDGELAEGAVAHGQREGVDGRLDRACGSALKVSRVLPPRSTYSASDPSTSTTIAPALRPGRCPVRRRRRRRSGQGSAAPNGLAGSVAASTSGRGLVLARRHRPLASNERSRSTAPVMPNCAAPKPATK